MIDEKTYDELDRYLRGEMRAEERAAFDARLSADDELRAELEWLSAAGSAFHSAGKDVMKKQVAGIFAGVPAASLTKYTPSVNGKRFLKKWWWGGAIVIAAAAAVIVWWNYPHGEEEHAPAAPAQDTSPAPQQPDSAPAAQKLPDSCSADSVTTVSRKTTIHHDTMRFSGEGKSSAIIKKDSVRIITRTQYREAQKK